jgi:tetrapyrrole methylase family protein/MazG family protein
LKEIIIVGLGPGTMDDLSLGVWNILKKYEKIFMRTHKHPVIQELANNSIEFETFDYLYEEKESFCQVYDAIIQRLINELEDDTTQKQLVYGVPGNPLVGEESVKRLLKVAKSKGIRITIKPGMSFLDAVYGLLEIDPTEGFMILDALSVNKENLKISSHQLFLQVHSRLVASDLKLLLLEVYNSSHPVVIIRAAGIVGEESIVRVPLCEMDHYERYDHLTSIYLEPSYSKQNCEIVSSYPLDPLVEILEKLLAPHGCPWDRKQNHDSLKTCLIEETYEVIEAIDSKDMNKLREELGDLLLQVVFHATLAQNRGDFTNNDVIKTVVEKMIRRHPHVFSDVIANDADDVIRNWEKIKAVERGEVDNGNTVISKVMQKLNRSLPALLLAEEVQMQANKVGFDWEDVQGAWNKVFEEINELKKAKEDKLEIENELGDLLFSIVNLARFLKVSPELSLLRSTNKFIKRFNFIEETILNNGKKWDEMELMQLEKIWEEAKKEL